MNHFEALANAQMVSATKAKHRAREKRAAAKVVKSDSDAPMKLSAQEQDQADQSTQFRAYRRSKREEIKLLLEPHKEWPAFSKMLKGLTIDNAEHLIFHVDAAAWLHGADLKTRQAALSAIADAIIRLRIVNGYSPMADSLPGEEPTVFEVIRDRLKVMT
jgi:hypothetical protein